LPWIFPALLLFTIVLCTLTHSRTHPHPRSGQVIVIGATNRPDAIDPALRRPGRFDRELYFPLPARAAREEILGIHTRQWAPAPAPALIAHLSTRTAGYCGADLRALCSGMFECGCGCGMGRVGSGRVGFLESR
jgi:SpoVK/Ycf46/Vps4 family AAA+-type ATPase